MATTLLHSMSTVPCNRSDGQPWWTWVASFLSASDHGVLARTCRQLRQVTLRPAASPAIIVVSRILTDGALPKRLVQLRPRELRLESGALTEKQLEQVGGMLSLTKLNVWPSSRASLTPLSRLVQLEELTLQWSSHSLEPLSALPSLKHLTQMWLLLGEVVHLPQSLRSLSQVCGPWDSAGWDSLLRRPLTTLDLGPLPLDADQIRAIATMTTLVCFTFTPASPDVSLAALGGTRLPSLTSLTIRFLDPLHASLSSLTQLRILNFKSSAFGSVAAVNTLRPLTCLHTLGLEDCCLEDSGLVALGESGLPLTSLNIATNDVQALLPLSGLSALQVLNCSNCHLSPGTEWPNLRNQRNLRFL